MKAYCDFNSIVSKDESGICSGKIGRGLLIEACVSKAHLKAQSRIQLNHGHFGGTEGWIGERMRGPILTICTRDGSI